MFPSDEAHVAVTGPVAGTQVPEIVQLDDPRAVDPRLTGSKAAALARAGEHGLPVVPGFVITTGTVDALPGRDRLPARVRQAWSLLSADGARPLVVRSSSCIEDLAGSLMAGRFSSVVGVRGEQQFAHAVATVVASRTAAAEGSAGVTGREPLAVLVQPLVPARCGGVLFGLDPVTGREDRHLDLLAGDAPRLSVRQRLDPRPPLRRLRASWRVGRLQAALPWLARDVLQSTDAALMGVPALQGLSDAQLVALLHRTGPALTSVHAHEVLIGLLVDPAAPTTTGAGAALRLLAAAR
ncbi:MAG: ppsA2, partial [Frankiales bacterium]|nr:ppsA2 [Frankiales bacterium]